MPQNTDKTVYLLASGDSRPAVNEICWAAQETMEKQLTAAVEHFGWAVVRAHPYKPEQKHGFLASQREGLDVMSKIPAGAPVIVAESVRQCPHHIYPGLLLHKGPILTVADWSPARRGLAGLLNLNGCLIKAGREFSTLWSGDFTDARFRSRMRIWLKKGIFKHKNEHVKKFKSVNLNSIDRRIGKHLAKELRDSKPIIGIFNEGCTGMYNTLIQDELLFPLNIFKERLSQSALYYATMDVSDEEAEEIEQWCIGKGLTFHYGTDPATELTRGQVLLQCKMYIAAVHLAAEFGCSLIGIQEQPGSGDLLPASGFAEGLMNNAHRPPVKDENGNVLFDGKPLMHFSEIDEGAALDALLNNRVADALGQPVETMPYDVRWGAIDPTGTVDGFVWLFMISGAAPPAHLEKNWKGSHARRQSPMFFKKGGAALTGTGRPGEIVWSRLCVAAGKLRLDLGRGRCVSLPKKEMKRRAESADTEYPVVNAVLDGVSRDQFMSRQPANRIQIVYADSAEEANRMLAVKGAMAEELGIKVYTCGL
ncbi:MAG: fucose isomerase [Planctomycetaceae bacterium]|nr:fucose isomerase [Planctomycetaceae bacterium]